VAGLVLVEKGVLALTKRALTSASPPMLRMLLSVCIDHSPFRTMYTFMYMICIYMVYRRFVSPLCAEHSRMGGALLL